MSKDLVSIIIPVYNAEKYLRECLDSVLSQTYPSWECILVDDGSPDGSGDICDEYCKKDGRFKVVHKQNEGVTKARKDGVSVSKGTWITFVDADDLISNNAIDCLYKYSENVDIVIGAWKKKYYSYERLIPLLSNGEYCPNDLIASYLGGRCYFGPVGKLFRKSLFDVKTFDLPRSIIYSEDLIMNIRLAQKAKRIYCSAYDAIYTYRYNAESTSNSNRVNDWEAVFSIVQQEIDKDNRKDFYIYFLSIHSKYCKTGDYEDIISDIDDFVRQLKGVDLLSIYYKCIIKKDVFAKLCYKSYIMYNNLRKVINIIIYTFKTRCFHI